MSEHDNNEPIRSGEFKVVIVKDGPYLLMGGIPLNRVNLTFDRDDYPLDYKVVEEYPEKQVHSLCRCGKSQNGPFCDGTHTKTGFDGTEHHDIHPYNQKAHHYSGRNLLLLDYRDLCIGVGFCHRAGSTWVLTRFSDNPAKRKIAIETSQNCPSGRLTACDKKTGKPIEQDWPMHISLIDDQRDKTRWPLWLKGGIPIQSADGSIYEVRFRVTLCSCGKSRIKPFCDGNHYFA